MIKYSQLNVRELDDFDENIDYIKQVHELFDKKFNTTFKGTSIVYLLKFKQVPRDVSNKYQVPRDVSNNYQGKIDNNYIATCYTTSSKTRRLNKDQKNSNSLKSNRKSIDKMFYVFGLPVSFEKSPDALSTYLINLVRNKLGDILEAAGVPNLSSKKY